MTHIAGEWYQQKKNNLDEFQFYRNLYFLYCSKSWKILSSLHVTFCFCLQTNELQCYRLLSFPAFPAWNWTCSIRRWFPAPEMYDRLTSFWYQLTGTRNRLLKLASVSSLLVVEMWHSNCFGPVQSRRLSLFGHIARMPDETDAKQILTASPAGNWTRPLGRPRITWMKTIQQDLKSSDLNMDDAVDLARNRRPL